MSKNQEIASYYNSTQHHYERWWNLAQSKALHYGIWTDEINTHAQALENTNRMMMLQAKIQKGDRVLDAGCGVGGAAFFLSDQCQAEVVGITLSEKQLAFAQKLQQQQPQAHVDFHLMDYTDTSFDNASFDMVWACESVSSAPDKTAFFKEAFRLLKPGGRLVMAEYFLTEDAHQSLPIIQKWSQLWSMNNLISYASFAEGMKTAGFSQPSSINYTQDIKKSARHMYRAGILGALPSEVYNLFHPKVSSYGKHHYRSCIYQYQALQRGLWEYRVVTARK